MTTRTRSGRTFSRVEPGGGSTSWRGRRGRRHRLLAGRPGSSPTRSGPTAPRPGGSGGRQGAARPPAQQAATVARCTTWTTPPAVVTAVLACPGMARAGPHRQRLKRDGPPVQPGYRRAMPGPGNLAATLRHHARDPGRPGTTLGCNGHHARTPEPCLELHLAIKESGHPLGYFSRWSLVSWTLHRLKAGVGHGIS